MLVEEHWIDGRREGVYKMWYRAGKKWIIGHYEKGLRHGPWIYWFQNENLLEKGAFFRGKRQGPWVESYKNGQKKMQGVFVLGKWCGHWRCWGQDGKTKPCTLSWATKAKCHPLPTGSQCSPCPSSKSSKGKLLSPRGYRKTDVDSTTHE